MAEQLIAVGLGFIVLAWIIQAYSAFSQKKGLGVLRSYNSLES